MSDRAINIIFILFCLVFVAFVYLTININPPFGIATMSRALYVDEGFYADAAQNFVRFGDWGMPHDLRHWPGAPMLTVLQTTVFSLFGVSVTAARLISVAFAVLSIICLYLISQKQFGSRIALVLSIATAVSFNFVTHSRAAIADPIAVGFSMLAMLVYLRMDNRSWAIVISLLMAYCAFLSKMYFLFAIITLFTFWIIEIVIIPLVSNEQLKRSRIFIMFITVAIIIVSYLLLRLAFEASFSQFMHINSNKKPTLNIMVLWNKFIIAVNHVLFNTKTHLLLISSLVAVGGILFGLKSPKLFSQKLFASGRAGWLFMLFLLLGLGTVGALNLPDKAHYFYFSIIPICFLSVWLIKLAWPQVPLMLVMLLLISHIIFQTIYYVNWFDRDQNYAIAQANAAILTQIKNENPDTENVIPIIGQYASQFAFKDDQIMPLDIRWSSQADVCVRINYWQPQYLVDFYFPARGNYSKDKLLACDEVVAIEEISSYPVFEQWQDQIEFYRLIY